MTVSMEQKREGQDGRGLDQSNEGMYERDFETDTILFSDDVQSIFSQCGIWHHFSNNSDFRSILHPDDRETVQSWIACTFKKSGAGRVEFRVKLESGNYIGVQLRSASICDEQGAPIKALGVIRYFG